MAAPIHSLTFRHDINGLRAWAILLVLGYHFGLAGMDGGFIGVDLFFVISGFLMTVIIGSRLDSGTFGFLRFYLDRAKRLLPALLALGLVLLTAGWFILLQGSFTQLCKDLAFSLVFLSNTLPPVTSHYLQGAAPDNFLLHTWSLSVEWQFYLLYPLLCLALWRPVRTRSQRFTGLLLFTLLSLGLCLAYATVKPGAAFYSLPCRAWEMCLGGLVSLSPRLPGTARQREAAGFLLILAALFLIDRNTRWPGPIMLLPTLGGALILTAGQTASPLTRPAILQWVGNRSYSIYLWHWPIAAALQYAGQGHTPSATAGGILASLVAGHLSYHAVEQPVRRIPAARSPIRLAAGLAGALTLLLIAILAARKIPVEWRLSPAMVRDSRAVIDRNPNNRCFTQTGPTMTVCRYGHGPLRAVLVGDSHAQAVATALAVAAGQTGGSIEAMAYSGCPGILGVETRSALQGSMKECSRAATFALTHLSGIDAAVPVIFMIRTTAYTTGNPPLENAIHQPGTGRPIIYLAGAPTTLPDAAVLAGFRKLYLETACRYSRTHPLYIVRPIPEMGRNVPLTLGWQDLTGIRQHFPDSLAIYRQRHADTLAMQDEAANLCGARLLDPVPLLCPDGTCRTIDGNDILYYDDDHLSEHGNRKLIPMFRAALGAQTPLAQPRPSASD